MLQNVSRDFLIDHAMEENAHLFALSKTKSDKDLYCIQVCLALLSSTVASQSHFHPALKTDLVQIDSVHLSHLKNVQARYQPLMELSEQAVLLGLELTALTPINKWNICYLASSKSFFAAGSLALQQDLRKSNAISSHISGEGILFLSVQSFVIISGQLIFHLTTLRLSSSTQKTGLMNSTLPAILQQRDVVVVMV